MTVRIGWDEYEVALLIDACNRIRDNKIDKAECVHKLSNLLRQRAKANGNNIDEVYRKGCSENRRGSEKRRYLSI